MCIRLDTEGKIEESTGSVPGEFRWRSESDEIVFGAEINLIICILILISVINS